MNREQKFGKEGIAMESITVGNESLLYDFFQAYGLGSETNRISCAYLAMYQLSHRSSIIRMKYAAGHTMYSCFEHNLHQRK